MIIEANFDGLPGLTHNFAGLSFGNVASTKNANIVSKPKAAIKQSLEKISTVMSYGIPQGIFIPHERPAVNILKEFGFSGSDADILNNCYKRAPHLFLAAYSSSAMWTANSATFTPACDSTDKKFHITPANLISNLHRSIECRFTTRVLKNIFNNAEYVHHPALFPQATFADEGAANHTRLCTLDNNRALHLFIYGKQELSNNTPAPNKFPARQTKEACETISRNHNILKENLILAQQLPQAIDKGVFHNDVISVGHENILLIHEYALINQENIINDISRWFANEYHEIHVINNKHLNLNDAVSTYIFNSQLITKKNGKIAIVVPKQCEENIESLRALEKIITESKRIDQVIFMDLRESMRNGGGPACLRLRVPLSKNQITIIEENSNWLMTKKLITKLNNWADKHYPDQLTVDNLRDPQIISIVRTALDELTQILAIGNIYDFQR